MKNLLLFSLLIFVLSCEEEKKDKNPNNGNLEHKVQSENQKEFAENNEGKEIALFDMHPVPEIEKFDLDENWEWSSIRYYSGDINGESIDLILTPTYKEKIYTGRYIYLNNGVNFDVNAEISESKDSILIERKKNGELRELFLGEINSNLSEINGNWIKSNDTLVFSLKEVVSNPEQTQVFINLENSGQFSNTSEGIVLQSGYADIEVFNSFTYGTTMGSAYDFGEEWTDNYDQVFFQDSLIIFVEVEINNSVSTVFKPGHEPDGPEYNDPDGVEAIKDELSGKIKWTIINNGIKTIDFIDLNEEMTSNLWLFRQYIVLSNTDYENNNYIVYRWNNESLTFEKI